MLQSEDRAEWQVPEGWAGNLTEGRIVFLASNPTISEAEYYPRGSWDDDAIADYTIRRFGEGDGFPATIGGRGRRLDGEPSRVTKSWAGVRGRAAELIPGARPDRHYVMTEVVHCKSRAEVGVIAAAPQCVRTHLDAIVALSPAPLIVVLGGKARDRIAELWHLPDGFGTRGAIGHERRNLAIRTVGGTERLIAYLGHPTGSETRKFCKVYPEHLSMLIALANGHMSVAEAARILQD